jgi:hypothetical protein
VCNKWLTLPASPEILNVDALYEAAHAQKRLDASALAAGRDDRLSGGGGVVLKKTRSYEYAATDSPSGSLDESVSLNQSQVTHYILYSTVPGQTVHTMQYSPRSDSTYYAVRSPGQRVHTMQYGPQVREYIQCSTVPGQTVHTMQYCPRSDSRYCAVQFHVRQYSTYYILCSTVPGQTIHTMQYSPRSDSRYCAVVQFHVRQYSTYYAVQSQVRQYILCSTSPRSDSSYYAVPVLSQTVHTVQYSPRSGSYI